MSHPADRAARDRVPDLPQWVDTRGMLLTGRARVSFLEPADYARDGFVVELASRALLSAVDRPPASLIAERAHGLSGDVNVLCLPDMVEPVAAALPGWRSQGVRLHALPGVMPWEADGDPDVTVFVSADAPALHHIPDALREELEDALAGHPAARFVPGALPPYTPADLSPTPVPVAAAWVDGRPVAFCYPVLQTERWWDVSVDTLEEFRGRGLAPRAAREMVRLMRTRGKSPVWGAVETNAASLSVARRLGFVEAGRLAVFTAA
jgi:RimJ/RimL family protein N-acetyltransferase